MFEFDIDIEIERIKRRILQGEPIEEVLSRFHWQAFESAIAQIFAANGFHVLQSLRFKTSRRWEIDIVATKPDVALCVDCKEWRGGRYKKTAIHKAAEEQTLRTEAFSKFVSINPILRHSLKVRKGCRFIPAIVTLMEEDVDIGDDWRSDNALVIPVSKLNMFLNSSF
jgi:Holliday junction resolvase